MDHLPIAGRRRWSIRLSAHKSLAGLAVIVSVARGALKPGDLVFYREGSTIGHVGLYIGGGDRIDAPQTGYPIRVDPVGNYTTARRYLTS